MHTVKILHCADVHIGAAESFLGNTAASRRFETLLTFERIISEASAQGVKLVLIAGDLFDSNSVEQTFIDRVFSAITSAQDIEFCFAAGNHDPLTPDSPFKKQELPSNLHVLGTEDECIEFPKLSVRVYGRSFSDVHLQGRPRFSILPPNDDIINIMVIHGELKADLNSDYNAITQGFISESGMDYIALGHVHKKTPVGRIKNTFCAYCGCPEGQGFDETDQKGVYIGDISKARCELKFVPISKRQHICEKIDISSCGNSAEISALISSQLKSKYGDEYGDNLYKIILVGSVPQQLDISIPEISGRLCEQVYFAKVSDKTEIKPDLDALSGEKTLKGIFTKRILEKIEGSDREQAELLRQALNIGLRAFKGEVSFDED